MKTHLFIVFVLLLGFSVNMKSQTLTPKPDNSLLVQFSGVVLDQDSLTPIPFVAILIKGSKRGTVSDFYGFFSLVINPGDELEFHSVSHKARSYKVADTLKQKYYYAIQVLAKDTVHLPVVDIYPWPSKDEFKRAFLNLDLSDSDAERAENNLQRETMTYLERNKTADAALNYKYAMQTRYTKVYTAGQQPVNNLLNPVKWAEFIDSWRKGKLKIE